VLKWALPPIGEQHADVALLLRNAIGEESVAAMVPALWLYEVGNTLARRFPAHAKAWLSAMVKVGMEEVAPTSSWLDRTLELTRLHDVAFYDAAYHALALERGGVLVTADGRYVERAGASGSVIALGDWRP
jgi:predicted nucleic acid-binding protein